MYIKPKRLDTVRLQFRTDGFSHHVLKLKVDTVDYAMEQMF